MDKELAERLISRRNYLYQHSGPPRGLGEQGENGIHFKRTGEQRLNFEGNKDKIGEQGT